MKILQVSAHYPPFLGGIANHIQEVSRRLAAGGDEVTVVTADPTGTLPTDELDQGVRIRRVRSYPAREDFFLSPGIARLIGAGDWDVMHCQGSHTLVPPVAIAAAVRRRLPFVVTFHTGVHSSPLRNRLRPLEWRLLRPLFGKADHFVGVSTYEARYFAEHLGVDPARFTVIPNGADFPPLPEGTVARPTDPPTIITIGRLERYKGHHRVVEALPQVLRRVPEARVLVLGSGPYEPDLRALAARLGVADRVKVELIPPSEKERLARTLAGAALVTLLSEGESHPLAVLEAASLGCSILVADDAMGCAELAGRGLARVIPLGSTPDQVAAAISNQIAHPFRPDQVVLPTWDDCARRLRGVYQQISEGMRCAS